MADLLECLIQIKALAETPAKIGRLLTCSSGKRWSLRPGENVWAPVEVVAHLADCELLFAVRLLGVLTRDKPVLAMFDPERIATWAGYLNKSPIRMVDLFQSRRAETVELLSCCTADELSRTGIHPRRGEITLADIVAISLAHDTDHVGQIRQRLGLCESLDNAQGEKR